MSHSKLKSEQLSMLDPKTNLSPTGDVDRMATYCPDAVRLMRNRNAIYRGSYRGAGLVGAAAQLKGCVDKLWTLVTVSGKEKFEDEEGDERITNWRQLLRNVLVDLHNFSLIALLMLDEDNFDGAVTVEQHYE